MNCIYCQQACQIIIPGPQPDGLWDSRIAQCDDCQVGYYKSFHVLHCTFNGKEYFTTYMDDHPDHWVSVYCKDGSYSDSTFEDDLKGPKDHRIILHFTHHVIFTPQNFKNKLQIYLLFS
jgi:hypothetical protein